MNSLKNILMAGCTALLLLPIIALAETRTISISTSPSTTSPTTAISENTNGKLHEAIAAKEEKATSTRKGVPLSASTSTAATGTQDLPSSAKERIQEREKNDCIGDPSGQTDCAGKRGERREEALLRQETKKNDIAKNIAKKMIVRFEAAVHRLEKIADRIDSRIAKLKEKNGDTSSSETLVAVARAKLKHAQNEVVAAKNLTITIASSTIASTTPAEIGREVRDLLDTAREAIGGAHKALVDALVSLKMVRINTSTASSTDAQTSTTTQQ